MGLEIKLQLRWGFDFLLSRNVRSQKKTNDLNSHKIAIKNTRDLKSMCTNSTSDMKQEVK